MKKVFKIFKNNSEVLTVLCMFLIFVLMGFIIFKANIKDNIRQEQNKQRIELSEIKNTRNPYRYEVIEVEGCRYLSNKYDGGLAHLETCGNCVKLSQDISDLPDSVDED